jgi:hypothetical protein
MGNSAQLLTLTVQDNSASIAAGTAVAVAMLNAGVPTRHGALPRANLWIGNGVSIWLGWGGGSFKRAASGVSSAGFQSRNPHAGFESG